MGLQNREFRPGRWPDFQVLGRLFQRYPDILAVYLFGSSAAGSPHTESDLDLAILPRQSSVRARKLEILTDLARHGFCNIDLVFLDTEDIVLKYEAIRQNRLVYQAEDFDRGATYSRIVRQYLDFVPYLEVQRKAYKRRALLGPGGSDSQATEQVGRVPGHSARSTEVHV